MLPREILKEYNTEKTAQNFGKKLFLRYFQDLEQTPGAQTVTGIPMDVWLKQNELQEVVDNPQTSPEEKAKAEEAIEKLRTKAVFKLLKKFEEIDPTNNKEYVQWMVRTYINDQMSIEDIGSTVAEYLAKFNALKIKRHIKPPKNDIGQYKSFNDFMNEVDQYQDPLEADKDKQAERGKYELIYDADNLLVLKPKDKTSACFFGRGTRWCTAATRGHNYFSHYNRQGPMYIIIPRKPSHPGEKYQFHFDSRQYAEESDTMLNQGELVQLVEKYPQLADIFKQQAEEYGLFWLQKPIIKKDETYTLYIYKKNNRPFLRVVPKNPSHEGEEYFIEKDINDRVEIRNESNRSLSPIEKYNFVENMPGLTEKLGIDIDGYDPKTAEKIQKGDNTYVKFGEKYAIIDTSDGKFVTSLVGDTSYGSGDLKKGIYRWVPKSEQRRSTYEEVNPYEFMIEHPELNTMFKDALNRIQNATSDLGRRHGSNSSAKYGWMAPHSSIDTQNGKVYEFGQNGKPVAYYIKDNDVGGQEGIVFSMDPNGEVDNIETMDARGNLEKMSFLQQVAFLDRHADLKDMLPGTKAFNPEEIDIGNAVLKKYHTQTERADRDIITKDNYFLIPKDPSRPGEKYSLTIKYRGEAQPATDQIENKTFVGADISAFADDRAKPIDLTSTRSYGYRYDQERSVPGLINHFIEKFPGLEKFVSPDNSMSHSGGYGYDRTKYVPGQTIDNDRVKVKRFDEVDRAGNATSHGTPRLLVTDKQTGDSYVVTTQARDRRGKTGKIGRIEVNAIPKDLINWGETDDDKKLNAKTLGEAEIIALFRKFPEMVDVIKKENIHPKSPHPALVKVADSEEDLQVKTDTFRVERRPDDPGREDIFFKDPNKENVAFQYSEDYNDRYGRKENLPAMITIASQMIDRGYRGDTEQYGSHAWYRLMNENPALKEYVKERTKNDYIGVVGAGEPDEVKTLGNIREYIFNAKNGRMLYFTPITNPVKDSPGDTADSTWFNNGIAVPLSPTVHREVNIPTYMADNEEVKKEIQAQADEVQGKHTGIHGSGTMRHLADTTDTIPAGFSNNENLYNIKKAGSQHPVYKFIWNVPESDERRNYYRAGWIAPTDMSDHQRRVEREEQYPNPALAEFFIKIMKEVPYYGNSYRNLINSHGLYVRPDNGDIGFIDNDGSMSSINDSISHISLVNALYKNMPELKKLIPPKKAKESGVAPEQVRKLNQSWNSEDKFYLSVVKKPHGAKYAGRYSWREGPQLPPGTAYEMYYKTPQGTTRINNILYFPDKGPVVIFDGRGEKETYTTDQKISRFLDRYPELKDILSPFAKSNKWLRESSEDIINYLLTESELVSDNFDDISKTDVDPYVSLLENELAESLGDLAWAKREAEKRQQNKPKKEWKPNYHFVKPGELRGSYTDQQMKDMGFKMASSGNWYMPMNKFQDLIKSGKLREDEQAILEGRKLPRTSEFLHVKQDLMRLAGISEQKGDDSMGSNISYTASKISKIMKDNDIQPGTNEWFRLWFSKPYLTGETPYGGK